MEDTEGFDPWARSSMGQAVHGRLAARWEDAEGFDPLIGSYVPGSMGATIAESLGHDNPFNRPRPGRRAVAVDPVDAAFAAAVAQRDADKQANRIQEEVDRRLAQMDDLGADRLPDKAVVAFTKRHEEGGFAYSYVALRIGAYWYLSGDVNGSKRKTNSGFVTWLLSGQGFDDWQVLRGAPEATALDVVPASYHDYDDEKPF